MRLYDLGAQDLERITARRKKSGYGQRPVGVRPQAEYMKWSWVRCTRIAGKDDRVPRRADEISTAEIAAQREVSTRIKEQEYGAPEGRGAS
jgi:hypothetical protein